MSRPNWLRMEPSDFDSSIPAPGDVGLFDLYVPKVAPDPDECGTVDMAELLEGSHDEPGAVDE